MTLKNGRREGNHTCHSLGSGMGIVVIGGMCQDTDFSKKYELELEEKSLRMFPRISLRDSEHESEGL